MAAVKEVELVVPQGATFIYEMTYVDPLTNNAPVNLTGFTARMQVRAKLGDAAIVYSADTTADMAIPAPATGVVLLTVPAAVTATWTFRRAVFDVEIVSSAGIVTRIVKGAMLLDREVTR